MKWQGRRQSDNVEDRRAFGRGKGKIAAGGGLIGIIVLLLSMFGGEQGQQVAGVLNQVNQGQDVSQEPTRELTAEEKELGAFASTVFADCEDVWSTVFEKNNLTYRFPKMVLFAESVQTDCGPADAAVGPFYCPADETVYMDLTFFEELKTRFGAEGGDFAIAYVIAHEVGHHVQNVLGTSRKIREAQEGASEKRKNQLSVKLELQADFYAGIFSYYNKNYLEAGDIDEALSAAHAVGDDAIQKRMRGSVAPDSFTHGTSAQRKESFLKGFSSGDISQGEIRIAQ
jgi:predicted metalloprotease